MWGWLTFVGTFVPIACSCSTLWVWKFCWTYGPLWVNVNIDVLVWYYVRIWYVHDFLSKYGWILVGLLFLRWCWFWKVASCTIDMIVGVNNFGALECSCTLWNAVTLRDVPLAKPFNYHVKLEQVHILHSLRFWGETAKSSTCSPELSLSYSFTHTGLPMTTGINRKARQKAHQVQGLRIFWNWMFQQNRFKEKELEIF